MARPGHVVISKAKNSVYGAGPRSPGRRPHTGEYSPPPLHLQGRAPTDKLEEFFIIPPSVPGSVSTVSLLEFSQTFLQDPIMLRFAIGGIVSTHRLTSIFLKRCHTVSLSTDIPPPFSSLVLFRSVGAGD